MKKITLLLLLLLFMFKLSSQVVFCPNGAEWNYNYTDFWTPNVYPVKIVYARDTIVGNDTLKILDHGKFFTQCATRICTPTYIKQKGDTVFMKNNCTNGIWQVLYNFAAQAGQSWYNTLQVMGTPTVTANYTVSVLSISTVTVNGFTLKELTAEYKFNYQNFSMTESPVKITERFGCSRHLFNFYNRTVTDCDLFVRNLCYKDSVFGLKQFTAFPCDYNNPLSISEIRQQPGHFDLYPNPANDVIQIRSSSTVSDLTIKISDTFGRNVKIQSISSQDLIKVSDLQDGMYLVTLLSEDGIWLYSSKFIKQ